MKEQLISLYEDGAWVNERLLQAASDLAPEQFTQTVLPGFGSVHRTLAHILSAEVLWFARWQGLSPPKFLIHRQPQSPLVHSGAASALLRPSL